MMLKIQLCYRKHELRFKYSKIENSYFNLDNIPRHYSFTVF